MLFYFSDFQWKNGAFRAAGIGARYIQSYMPAPQESARRRGH